MSLPELLELLERLTPEWEARDRVILLLTKEGLEKGESYTGKRQAGLQAYTHWW